MAARSNAADKSPAVNPNKLLKLPEVLEELDVSPDTFYKWRSTGSAPKCIKLPNGQLRVRRHNLDAWLAEREGSVA